MSSTTTKITAVNLLLVEDDHSVAHTVCEGLDSFGYHINHATNIAEANNLLKSKRYDAMILDLTLPDGDGLEFSSTLRATGINLPILMLTARDSVPDRLAGFDHGADDYLGKPFDIDELAARVRALLRRVQGSERHVLYYEDLKLDLLTRTVHRRDIHTVLSDREAALLAYFLQHPEEILTRERILNEVWGDEVEEDSNVLNVFINLLRNKIESTKYQRLIHAIRGVGYQLSIKEPEELS